MSRVEQDHRNDAAPGRSEIGKTLSLTEPTSIEPRLLRVDESESLMEHPETWSADHLMVYRRARSDLPGQWGVMSKDTGLRITLLPRASSPDVAGMTVDLGGPHQNFVCIALALVEGWRVVDRRSRR